MRLQDRFRSAKLDRTASVELRGNSSGKGFSYFDRRHGLRTAVLQSGTRRGSAGTADGSGASMAYRHTIDATSYVFADLRDLLAQATPPRSGDRLAGVAPPAAREILT